MVDAGPLLLVGCGKMGGALLRGWLNKGLPAERFRVIEPQPGQQTAEFARRGVAFKRAVGDLDPAWAPIAVVLAVKPQVMDQALPTLSAYANTGALFVSVAAGTLTTTIAKHVGAKAAVVRAMPNTPAAVGKGMTVLYANENVSKAQRKGAQALMATVGAVAWVEEEPLMDAVTAVSGSGPAYVFLLVEALAEAGARAGLAPEVAAQLARETVAGAGALLDQASEDAATLRRNVTSPGGTTAAALEVLMAEDGLTALMTRAVAAAAQRSRDLAG